MSGREKDRGPPQAGREGLPPPRGTVASALARGRTLEHLGCPLEALLVYDEALALPETERSLVDVGRLMHRIGGCALETDDGPRAFASYLEAGRRAWDLGLRRHCGESLAAAGWTLAAHPIAAPVADVVAGDLVAAAFDGLLEEAREVLLDSGRPLLARAMIVHARFAGLTILSAEALLDEAPSLAAEGLFHDVVTPFRALHDVANRTMADEVVVITFLMGALARLCRGLCEQGRQHHAGVSPPADDVAAMARFVADAFVSDLREPVQGWLGAYLRDRRRPSCGGGRPVIQIAASYEASACAGDTRQASRCLPATTRNPE